MRFALCLSGQLRTYVKTYHSLKTHIIDGIKPDIFIHTWDRLGIKDPLESIKAGIPTRYQDTVPTDISHLVELYQPKGLLIEEDKSELFKTQSKIIKPLKVANWYRIENGLSMQYSVFKANSIKSAYEKQHGFRYDGVIRCRFDLAFSKPIDIEANPEKLSKAIFLAPKMNEDWKIPFEMPNDQFAYSCSDLMDYYSSLYNLFESYVKLRKFKHFDFPFTGEGMLKSHLFDSPLRPMGITIEESTISMKIVR